MRGGELMVYSGAMGLGLRIAFAIRAMPAFSHTKIPADTR